MTRIDERQYYNRLEDFIEIAKQGNRIEMEVDLKTLPMIQEVQIEKKHDMKKIKKYLLIAYYTFRMNEKSYQISKVYVFATQEESLNSLRVNKEIANARLQVDYNRLKVANIHFHEKYF